MIVRCPKVLRISLACGFHLINEEHELMGRERVAVTVMGKRGRKRLLQ